MGELETGVNTPAYLELSNLKFMLSLPENREDNTLKEKLMAGIQEGNMAPYYCIVCADLNWKVDEELLLSMQAVNKTKLSEYDKVGSEKSNNDDDDVDVDDEPKLWQEKLEYLCSIGDKEASLELATNKAQDTSLSMNRRLDAIFTMFRIAYFHDCDLKLMNSTIEKATELIDGGTGFQGDWSARNKLKAYEGICLLGHRNYSKAANLLLDAVPTFESYELIDFEKLIRYTVLSCMLALSRCEINVEVKKNSTLKQALHSYPQIKEFYEYFYDGQYMDFFICLAWVERILKNDKLLHPHYRHYVREMRVRAYSQLLQAYSSLSLRSMAEAFGVSEEYIEKEVSRFAALGKLQCKIDAVARRVIPNGFITDGKHDSKFSGRTTKATYDQGMMYQVTIKHGDILLNRLKKLARVVDF